MHLRCASFEVSSEGALSWSQTLDKQGTVWAANPLAENSSIRVWIKIIRPSVKMCRMGKPGCTFYSVYAKRLQILCLMFKNADCVNAAGSQLILLWVINCVVACEVQFFYAV